jgi:hypothetical protein
MQAGGRGTKMEIEKKARTATKAGGEAKEIRVERERKTGEK